MKSLDSTGSADYVHEGKEVAHENLEHDSSPIPSPEMVMPIPKGAPCTPSMDATCVTEEAAEVACARLSSTTIGSTAATTRRCSPSSRRGPWRWGGPR